MADLCNPFEYRGYCYDAYTGLYYLQSRYYDPNTGRFINADSTDYLNATGTVLGCNLFIYCENDPVNYIDYNGYRKWNIKWVDVTIDIVLIILPMVGQINSALAKLGKASSAVISKIQTFFSKYANKISNLLQKGLKKVFGKSLATQIAGIFTNGVFKALSMISIFSSIGNFIEYIIDCLDGRWNGYLDTNKKLKVQIVSKKEY